MGRLATCLIIVLTLAAGPATAQAPVCGSVAEGASLSLGCPSGQIVSAVAFASYGTPAGSCGGTPTAGTCHAPGSIVAVRSACVGRPICSVQASNGVFTDPCPGTLKRLTAQLSCGYSTAGPPGRCGAAADRGFLSLACPAGQVVTGVTFASYGTPEGGCGGYTRGACHAARSSEVVASQCLGRGTCRIATGNFLFGDPCPGIHKRLYTEVACGPAAPPPDGGTAADAAPARAGMAIGTNFWDLGWGIWDDTFKPNVDFATTTDPWQPAFLAEVKGYAALRFMDFGQVNGSNEQRWSDRTPRSAPAAQQMRLAYEWMIDLCNRTGRDMWVNLPHQSDADYSFQLASLISQNLAPGLKVYVEWSNETWNGVFAQTHYAYDRGNALALDADPWTAAFKYHVYAAVRVFEQFDRVFGADSPRLVKVIGGFVDNSWLAGVHLKALHDPVINPHGVKASAYAIAPYFGHGVDGRAATAAQDLHAAVQETIGLVKKVYDVVHPAGLPLLAYEGGQHVLTGADAINGQPVMYDLYTELLDGVAPYFALFMHYVHSGTWSSGGAWGSERAIGAPLDQAPKRRAIVDWQARQR
jgi:hypothetical protein